MLAPKVYLETTIFNRYFDVGRKYHEETKLLFEAIHNNNFLAFTSSYVVGELEASSEPKRSDMLDLITTCGIQVFETDQETDALAEKYIQIGIFPAKYLSDAAHVASASVHGIEYILSLNFRHINKLQTKILIGKINFSLNYSVPDICTPMEVLYGL
jgi:predicted nucleic acid-binding protein